MTHAGAGRDRLPGTAAGWGRYNYICSREATATSLTGSDDADHGGRPRKTPDSLLFGSFLTDGLEELRVLASALWTVAAAAPWVPCWGLRNGFQFKGKNNYKTGCKEVHCSGEVVAPYKMSSEEM